MIIRLVKKSVWSMSAGDGIKIIHILDILPRWSYDVWITRRCWICRLMEWLNPSWVSLDREYIEIYKALKSVCRNGADKTFLELHNNKVRNALIHIYIFNKYFNVIELFSSFLWTEVYVFKCIILFELILPEFHLW